MTVKPGANLQVATNRVVSGVNTEVPVEIFLSESMIIENGGKLSGDDWSGFRIYGMTSGSCPSQAIKISSHPITPATTSAAYESNLKNAFVWLKSGELILESTTQLLTSTPGLVGYVCQSNVSGVSIISNLSNRKFLEGLGGAYGFTGVFGGAAPIRFFYRGFGFSEQSTSS